MPKKSPDCTEFGSIPPDISQDMIRGSGLTELMLERGARDEFHTDARPNECSVRAYSIEDGALPALELIYPAGSWPGGCGFYVKEEGAALQPFDQDGIPAVGTEIALSDEQRGIVQRMVAYEKQTRSGTIE